MGFVSTKRWFNYDLENSNSIDEQGLCRKWLGDPLYLEIDLQFIPTEVLILQLVGTPPAQLSSYVVEHRSCRTWVVIYVKFSNLSTDVKFIHAKVDAP